MNNLRDLLGPSYNSDWEPVIESIENRRGGGRGRGRRMTNEVENNQTSYNYRNEYDGNWMNNQNRSQDYNNYTNIGIPNIPFINPFENKGNNYGTNSNYNERDINNRGRNTNMEYRPIGYNSYQNHYGKEEEKEAIKMKELYNSGNATSEEMKNVVIKHMLHMNEKKLEHGLKHMQMPNGEKKLSVEETEKLCREYNIRFEDKFKDVNKYDFNYAYNMMLSDYYSQKRTPYDYAHMAHQMLTDPDFPIPGTNANAWYETKIRYKELARELDE